MIFCGCPLDTFLHPLRAGGPDDRKCRAWRGSADVIILMKRLLILAILAASASIFLLCGLGVFIFREHRDMLQTGQSIENPFQSDKGLIQAMEQAEKPVSEEKMAWLLDGLPASARADDADSSQSFAAGEGHQIIFVGDSRTLGCRDAFGKSLRKDNCIFVGKVGEGCAWFLDEGIILMGQAIAEHPGLPVVLNFGVNDPDQISQYLSTYHDMIEDFPDTDFYFLSVNPVEEDMMREMEMNVDLINNDTIAILNQAIQSEWPERYINSASMLEEDGFETVDGIHFTEECYIAIHDFVVDELYGKDDAA